jgi:hypothetical protein
MTEVVSGCRSHECNTSALKGAERCQRCVMAL